MGKLAKSKLNLLRCRELILTFDINLFNGDKTPLSATLLIEPEGRACSLHDWEAELQKFLHRHCLMLADISVWTGVSYMTAHLSSPFKEHSSSVIITFVPLKR